MSSTKLQNNGDHTEKNETLTQDLSRLTVLMQELFSRNTSTLHANVTANGQSRVHVGDVLGNIYNYTTVVKSAEHANEEDDIEASSAPFESSPFESSSLNQDLPYNFDELLCLAAQLDGGTMSMRDSKSVLRHLVTLLSKIAASDEVASAASSVSSLCEDHLRDFLYRTVSIFEPTNDIRQVKIEGKT